MVDPPSISPYSDNLGTLKVGSFIGGTYRVLDFIGQGGMGFVYKVEHLMMAKILALKVLRSEQVSEEVWKRFRIEAQAIARLDHANVVRIYDMSQTEAGLPYYTMDLLVGESLADYLDEYYRLPLSEALPIFRQVCAGLAYAHDRGIIHRDIKPGNIMLLTDGRENAPPAVKIVDFGIAKLSSFDSGFGQGLTRPGEVFGSPLYMSPEQCSGQQLDHRTDMYSVGVTMFQALTGRPPLLGKTAIETTAMHQSVVPPAMADVIVLEEGEEPIVFPPELEEIVARLLAKAPDGRYDSLADVASELLALERGEIRKGQGAPGSADISGRAPYAVAEAARRRANYSKTQVLTSGQSDTDDVTSENKQFRSLVAAFAVTIVLVTTLGVAAFAIFSRSQAPVKTMATTRTGSLALPAIGAAFDQESKKSGFYDPDKLPDQLGKEEVANIKSYLKEHSGFYSHAATVNRKSLEVFEFPTKFSLGTLTAAKDGVCVIRRKPAQGRMEMPPGQNICLSASLAVKCFPELLNFFKPDDLREIDLNDIKHKSPALLPSLERFTRICRLEMKGTALTDSDLVIFSRLRSVRDLAIDNCDLPGGTLAHCQLLPQLWGLSVDRMTEVTPLLKVLSQSNNLTSLGTNRCKIGKQDCIYLGKMTKLENLSMQDNQTLTDDDIKQLTSMTNLLALDISCCNGLTLKALDSLEQMENLRILKVPESLSEPGCEERMRKVLKNLKVYE